MRIVVLVVALVSCQLAAAGQPPAAAGQAARILLDGRFDDWAGVAVAHADPADGDRGRPDLGRLWIANDERHLFLRLELGREIILQDGSDLVLYLDADDDADTGRRVRGLGVELEWSFGRRRGRLYAGPVSLPVEHQQIGLISTPTHGADEFEIALDRHALPRPEIPLFHGDRFRLAFSDGPDGDLIPDQRGGVAGRFDPSPLAAIAAISLDKQDPQHLRVLSYNLNDRLGRPANEAALRRIFGVLRPDLIVLQEIRSWSAQRTEEYVRQTLGSAPAAGGRWRAVQAGSESNVVLSPYPIAASHALGGSAAVVLESGEDRGGALLLIVLSAPCCDRDAERQLELDLIMAFLRDAKTPGGDVTVPAGTPIAVIGDANLVGSRRQLRTLLDGEIFHRHRHGPPFAPDWDGTALEDLMPRHTHRLKTFTWYGPDFSPGRLDVALISDSVLAAGNRFVLFTPDMPPDILERHGLHRHDVLAASDHLPLVVDLALGKPPVRRPERPR